MYPRTSFSVGGFSISARSAAFASELRYDGIQSIHSFAVSNFLTSCSSSQHTIILYHLRALSRLWVKSGIAEDLLNMVMTIALLRTKKGGLLHQRYSRMTTDTITTLASSSSPCLAGCGVFTEILLPHRSPLRLVVPLH